MSRHIIYSYELFIPDCNVELSERYGVIESPNFPLAYPGNRDCKWVIKATRGNTVNASFSHFNMEAQRGCTYDYLVVSNQMFFNFKNNANEITATVSGKNLYDTSYF